MTTLVLGLGNLVHSDDGLGVHAIQTLQRDSRVPADAVLMDGGTLVAWDYDPDGSGDLVTVTAADLAADCKARAR